MMAHTYNMLKYVTDLLTCDVYILVHVMWLCNISCKRLLSTKKLNVSLV